MSVSAEVPASVSSWDSFGGGGGDWIGRWLTLLHSRGGPLSLGSERAYREPQAMKQAEMEAWSQRERLRKGGREEKKNKTNNKPGMELLWARCVPLL